jgi:hypothetical protein
MAEPEDQLVFEMAEGGRQRFTKSVGAGEGETVLSEIMNSGIPWIDVGDGMYINIEKVASIELKLATDPERPSVRFG